MPKLHKASAHRLQCRRSLPQGIDLGNNVTLPLSFDPYLTLTALAPNSQLLTNTLGQLDASGKATARWTAIPQIPASFGGTVFRHAYVVFGNSPFDLASNPVPLTLVK